MDQPSDSLDFGSFSRLVQDARQGDAQARSEICRQVERHLRGMAEHDLDQALRRKLNPSDIAQQAMLRMIDGFEDFRGSNSREFYAWINSILRNEINTTRRDYRRHRRDIRREQAPADENVFDPVTAEPQPETEVQRREQLTRLNMNKKTAYNIDRNAVCDCRRYHIGNHPREVAQATGRVGRSISDRQHLALEFSVSWNALVWVWVLHPASCQPSR